MMGAGGNGHSGSPDEHRNENGDEGWRCEVPPDRLRPGPVEVPPVGGGCGGILRFGVPSRIEHRGHVRPIR
jgi:hypothetical protein